MEYLAYGFAALIVLYVLGLGFTLLIVPDQSRHYSWIIAPWVGYWYTAWACSGVYEFGGRISHFAAQMILLPPILCLAIVLFAKGFTSQLSSICSSRKTLGAMCLAGGAFLFFSLPVLWRSHGLTTVSLFNHDVAAYATVTRFLTDFTRNSSVGFVGQAFAYFNQYPAEGYFGVVSFAGFLSALLGVMPHQTTTLCINLFAALGAASLSLVLSDTLKVRTKMAFLGIALFAFHPAVYYIVLQGFFGQVVAIGLAVMIFWTHSKLIELPGKGSLHLTRYLILLTCFTSGLFMTYQHMLPFVWILIGVYSAILSFSRRDKRLLWVSTIGHLAAAVTAAALSPPRTIAYLAYLRWVGRVEGGWSIPFFSPDYLVGLSYQNAPFTMEDSRLHLIAAIAVSVIALLWLLMMRRKAGEIIVAFWLSCGVIYLGSIIMALRDYNGPTSGYKSFKVATFFLPFFAAAAVSLFNISAPTAWRKLSRLLKVLVLISLSFGYVRADARLLEVMRTNGKWVEPQYQDLLSIDRDSKVESVNIMGPNGWENMWAAYFLMHKKVYCEGPTYWGKGNMEGEYDLIEESANEPIRHLPGAQIPGIKRLNDRFYLVGPIPRE